MTQELLDSCRDFNKMYRLPAPGQPSLNCLGELWGNRVDGFKKTLLDEVHELDEIEGEDEVEVLTQIADLLGDVCVYCHSESVKYGIPLDKVLKVIMDSNMSKQNSDGTTSYDENGKVLKGPGYWKPEPKIRELIRAEILQKEVYNADVAKMCDKLGISKEYANMSPSDDLVLAPNPFCDPDQGKYKVIEEYRQGGMTVWNQKFPDIESAGKAIVDKIGEKDIQNYKRESNSWWGTAVAYSIFEVN